MRALCLLVLALGTMRGSVAITAVPACISVRTEARWRPFGYDHLVFLRSACAKPAACTVATNVNPEPIAVLVTPGTEVEVVTFQGAPGREFKPVVDCVLTP